MLKDILLTCSIQSIATGHIWLFKSQLKLHKIKKYSSLLTLPTCQMLNTTTG